MKLNVKKKKLNQLKFSKSMVMKFLNRKYKMLRKIMMIKKILNLKTLYLIYLKIGKKIQTKGR